MKSKSGHSLVRSGAPVITLSALLAAGPALADTGTWNTTTGTWDTTATNWTGVSNTPWDSTNGPSNTAAIGDSETLYTVTVSGSVYAGSTSLGSGAILNLNGATPTIFTGLSSIVPASGSTINVTGASHTLPSLQLSNGGSGSTMYITGDMRNRRSQRLEAAATTQRASSTNIL